ncbi:TRAPPC12 isoform 11, partial [Pan troglodytes]
MYSMANCLLLMKLASVHIRTRRGSARDGKEHAAASATFRLAEIRLQKSLLVAEWL